MRQCIDLTRLDVGSLTWLSPREARFHLTCLSKTYNYRTRKEHAELLQFFTVAVLAITKEVDKKICPVCCLCNYLKRTKELRQGHSALFITTSSLFQPAAKPTIANWVKNVLGKAGVDISIYAPHSIWSASSSKAYHIGISIHTIMRRAGWSRCHTFIDHYLKDVMPLAPNKNIESLVDGPVPDLPRISDNHHPEHAVQVEAELDRVRKMKTFAQLWESDPLGEGGSTVARMVSDFTQLPLVEVTRGSAVRSHSPDREEFIQKAPPQSPDTLPPLSLTEEDINFSSDDISTVPSLVTNTLPDSPLAPPPGWGDEPEHVDESPLVSLPMSQMENVPISVENQVQNNNVYHTGQEKKDQGFTAFRQKTINTPTGKIHKIAIVRKPLDALSKLAANPLPEFEEIRAPPKMYKKTG